ncbi:MAG: UvrD-helicase domain-containing protein [Christensenellaceae bacterium]|jgi:DNA helicase-2/ATP-dependent DNA helicase PcrA|nr:UvrD-helicase domain-containing protein [Christensenellaceae bacterium]
MDLSVLNTPQREAAECLEGPLLILAGAGSGKTRVLTYRIANLIEHGVKPWNILALTFTNKAANEMRERTEKLVDCDPRDIWVSTFHSACVRILRSDIDKLGRERNFVIYDDDDQMSLIGNLLKRLNLNEKEIPKREIKSRISDAKNKSLEPEQYLLDNPYLDDVVVRVYRAYQRALLEANALDFDDLLCKTLELFEQHPDTLEKYRRRFQYVLVDEYQDTNLAQYRFVELLCRAHRNICVVGDDDQSIYGWRGADIRNILEFEKDFEGARVIRLEQNYRSTSVILDAANAVIGNNAGRKRKKLWTDRQGGEKIQLFTALNEREEASFICKRVLEGVRGGRSYNDFAVLYRMNAQSRVIESSLINYGIPNKVFGGQRFYERKEVKDIMAYLRLIYNPADNVALRRIINIPRRGIGDTTVGELADAAERQGAYMLAVAQSGEGLQPKVRAKIAPFAQSMAEFIALSGLLPLSEFTAQLIALLEYEQYLKTEDKKGELENRMDNLRELIGNMKEIERDVPEGESALAAFLENVALVSDTDALSGDLGAVALMTLHTAKGLEFPVVFIPGMEENIFPTSRARNDMSQTALEEERRLCYVGMTRAEQQLYLINARQRTLYGDYSFNRPSRFLEEIPPELLLEEMEGEPQVQPVYTKPTARVGASRPQWGVQATIPVVQPVEKHFVPHQQVRHAKFGEGTVLELSGSGNAMTVTIDFATGGVKKFAAAYAPITAVEDQ